MSDEQRLRHLLDRARRGVILPAEGEQLIELVAALETERDTATARADRLRRFRDTWAAHARRLIDRALTAEAEVARLTAEQPPTTV